MAGGLRELHARLLDPLRMEFKIVQVSARRHGAGQRVRQRARARAALHHHAARPQLQLQAHHRDVQAVQNLGPEKYFNVDKKYFNWFIHSIQSEIGDCTCEGDTRHLVKSSGVGWRAKP